MVTLLQDLLAALIKTSPSNHLLFELIKVFIGKEENRQRTSDNKRKALTQQDTEPLSPPLPHSSTSEERFQTVNSPSLLAPYQSVGVRLQSRAEEFNSPCSPSG